MKARVEAAYTLYGVTEATLVRDSLMAALDYIEANKGYRRPIMMTLNAAAFAAAAEEAGSYDFGKPKPPPKPPDKSGRTRGAGPDHRVPKAS